MRKILFFMLTMASISFASCGDSSPEQKEFYRQQEINWKKCKEHMLSGDKIVQSERGGYYIVKNSGKYYRIGPTGTRSEVKKVYR